MPLYEYQCDACGHRFEVIRKFSDLPVEKCPVCEGAVHKLQSAPAFQFKGTGWYITDYARKDSVPASDSGGSPKTDASTSGEKSGKAEKSEKAEKTAETKESSGSSTSDKSASAPSAASGIPAK